MEWFPQNDYTPEQQRQLSQILFVIILAAFFGFAALLLLAFLTDDSVLQPVAAGFLLLLVLPALLLHRDRFFLSSWVLSLLTIAAVTLVSTLGQGYHDISVFAFPVILVLTSMTLNSLALKINFGLVLAGLAWLVFGEARQWYTPVSDPLSPAVSYIMLSFMLLVLAVVVNLLTSNLRRNLEQAREEIIQRQLSEKEKLKLQEQFAQKQKMDTIGQLAGGIAHDFNNQLAGILGYSEMLISSLEDETHRQYARNIQTGALNGARLTQQLLSFARKGQYKREIIDLNTVLDEVTGILERTIDRRIRIRQTRSVPSPTCLGDRSQIQNAVLNIALNARDAINGTGTITFETWVYGGGEGPSGPRFDLEPGRYICVSISDDGCGMDENISRHVFEPFFTTKGVGKGTGMGLPSAFGAVKHHGGGIFFESVPLSGTTFHILLPYRDAEMK